MKKLLEKIGLIILGILLSLGFLGSDEKSSLEEMVLNEIETEIVRGNLEKIEVEKEKIETGSDFSLEEGDESVFSNEQKEEVLKVEEKRGEEEGVEAKKENEKEEKNDKDTDLAFEVVENRELFSVYSVVDGDTLKINRKGKIETIRIIGIDTPETVHPTKAVQCFGKEASERAKYLLENKSVEVVYDDSQGRQDKYGRTLAYIILPNGQDFGEVMLKEGYAYEYTYDQKYQRQLAYKQAEAFAKQNKLGLWHEEACLSFNEEKLIQNNSSQNSAQTAAVAQTEFEMGGTLKNISSLNQNENCLIKGNINAKKEKIYHIPGQAFYEKTVITEKAGERWFCTEEEALAAGWRKALR